MDLVHGNAIGNSSPYFFDDQLVRDPAGGHSTISNGQSSQRSYETMRREAYSSTGGFASHQSRDHQSTGNEDGNRSTNNDDDQQEQAPFERPIKTSKACRVCGDKALGYNFNVITCESCKAFFRRNALKKQRLHCPFKNRCTITVASRRYCQKCRLKKCFDMGMRTEYIMTEEQRAQKRQRTQERDEDELSPSGSIECLDDGDRSVSDRERRRSSGGGSQSTIGAGYSSSSGDRNGSNGDDADGSTLTISLPKSTLLEILFNTNDRTEQMIALGRAVMSAASQSSGVVVINGRSPDTCVCPCTCSYVRMDRGKECEAIQKPEERKVGQSPQGLIAGISSPSGDRTASDLTAGISPTNGLTEDHSLSVSTVGYSNADASAIAQSPAAPATGHSSLGSQASGHSPASNLGSDRSPYNSVSNGHSPSLHLASGQSPNPVHIGQSPATILSTGQSPVHAFAAGHSPNVIVADSSPNNPLTIGHFVPPHDHQITSPSSFITLATDHSPASSFTQSFHSPLSGAEPSPQESTNQLALVPATAYWTPTPSGVSHSSTSPYTALGSTDPCDSLDFDDIDILDTITQAFSSSSSSAAAATTSSDCYFPMPPHFNAFKYSKLDELILGNNEWINPNQRLRAPVYAWTADEVTFQDVYNLASHALTMTIKQHLCLTLMKNLSFDDQQALFKACTRELVLIRSIMKYDTSTDQIQVQYPGREFVTSAVADRMRGGSYSQLKHMIGVFPEAWRRDELLMLMLSALALFNPSVPSLRDREAVEKGRRSYMELLKDYLINKYEKRDGKQMYEFLTACLGELGPWVEQHALKIVFELEPSNMEPMLVEIFDCH